VPASEQVADTSLSWRMELTKNLLGLIGSAKGLKINRRQFLTNPHD
jgi:hypothetical protein